MQGATGNAISKAMKDIVNLFDSFSLEDGPNMNEFIRVATGYNSNDTRNHLKRVSTKGSVFILPDLGQALAFQADAVLGSFWAHILQNKDASGKQAVLVLVRPKVVQ